MADLDRAVFALLDRAADPTPDEAPIADILRAGQLRKRQRRLLQGGSVVAAAAAVAGIVLVALNVSGTPSGNPPIFPLLPAPAPSGPTAQQIAHGHWANIPAPPFHQLCQLTTAWDGTELIVVSADIDCLDGVAQAGPAQVAAYDPHRNTWRTLPNAPWRANRRMLSTWTGDRLVLVAPGTGESAAYDPDSNIWQRLPDVPPTPPDISEPSLVTAGSQAVLVGVGNDGSGVVELSDNSWTRGPSIPARSPAQLSGVTAGAIGESVLAVATYQRARPHGVSLQTSLLRLDGAAWTALPGALGLPGNTTAIVPFNNRVLAIGTSCPRSLVVLSCPPISVMLDLIDPDLNADQSLPNWPLGFSDWDAVAAGPAVVSYSRTGQQNGAGAYLVQPGTTYVFDNSASQWLRGPRSVRVDNIVAEAWTPYGFVVLGSPLEKTTQRLGGLILRPATH